MTPAFPPSASAELPEPADGAIPAHAGVRSRYHVLVVLMGIGFGLTAPFTALLVVALGGAAQWAAYVVASMGLSLLAVDFFGTRFVPRLGPRMALCGASVVFGIGSLLSAVTTSWVLVGLARVLQGFGAALFMGGGVQIAARLVRPESRGGAIGTFNAAWFAGVALGPLGGGLIAAMRPGADGLRMLFAVCAALNLLSAVVAWFLAPRLAPGPRPRLGLPRGLGMHGARRWSVLVLAAVGQAIRSGLAMTLVPLLGEQLGMGWVPLGIALFALSLTDVAAMHFGSRFSDRRGRALPLAGALAWGAVATLALAFVVDSPLGLTLGALAIGVTVGASWTLPVAMTVDLATDQETGLAAYRIASDIGMLAGGVLAGEGLAAGGMTGALLATAAVLVASTALVLTVGETRRRPSTTVRATPDSHRVPCVQNPLEDSMPMPDLDGFAVIAANQDIALSPERLAQAHATHARFRPDLERLRALPLSYTEPVTEPAHGPAWIANGGRS